MLQAYPTKNGTGVSIFGDYGDLNSLYTTVHQIANSLSEEHKYQKGQHQLLMNFAYEIRKAFSDQRLKDKIQFLGDDEELTHYGFQVVWTDILICISALRHNAGFSRSNKRDQANLYLLEHIIEAALLSFDVKGANEIKEFIAQRINILNEYIFIIYQAIHIEFVTDKPGKVRFRKIPHLLTNYFSEWLPDYKKLIASFQQSAKEQNCEIIDLEFSEFPDIKW